MTVLTTKAKCKAARNMELALVRELHKAGVDFDCYVEFEFSQRTPGGPLHQTVSVYGDMKYGGTPEYFFSVGITCHSLPGTCEAPDVSCFAVTVDT